MGPSVGRHAVRFRLRQMANGGAVWTGDQIVAAIQAWAERTGHPPGADEWRAVDSSVHPSTQRVIRVFGSWNEAVAAAGFVPTRVGEARPGRRVKLPAGSVSERLPRGAR